ncbi:SapC family protein [Porticoccus sp. GXU_MW_L64]
MSQTVALDKNHHANLRVIPQQAQQHGAEECLMPVVISEFARLAAHYPIVISKNSDTGQFVCSALLGFEKGENLFWKQGQWDAAYKPLNVQRQPFFTAGSDNDILTINQDSPSVSTTEGERLFDNNQQETDYLQNIRTVLTNLFQGEKHSGNFIQTLEQFELLVPMTLDIKLDNGQPKKVEGLYTVNEQRLSELPDEHFLSLRKLGYLGSIYSMLTSLGQIYALIERKNKMLETATGWYGS